MKKLLFATVALVVLGAAGTLIYGDMPLKTYYPNGVLRTETQRSFFKKNGTHKEYHPNGQLKLEAMYVDNVQNGQEKQYLDNGTLKRKVTYVNGAKNGTETIYYDKSRIEIPYENGKKEGKANIIVSNVEHYAVTYKNNVLDGPVESIDDIEITILPDGQFSIRPTDEEIGSAEGRIVCPDEKLFEVAFINDEVDKTVALLRCLSIEKITAADEEFSFEWKGAFNFPRFTKTTTLTATDLKQKLKNISVPVDFVGEEVFKTLQTHYSPNKIILTISDDNQTISLNIPDTQNKNIIQGRIQFDDIAGLIETGIAISKDNDFNKLIPLLKNASLNEIIFSTAHATKDIALLGKIQPFLLKVADNTAFTIYNPDEKPVLEIKKGQTGVHFDIRYPLSTKPMLSFSEEIEFSELSKLQESLEQAQNTQDYMMIGMTYGQNPTETIPQKVIIKDLKLTGADGTVLAQSDKISIYPNKQHIDGMITITGENNQQVKIAYANQNQISITDTNGSTQTIDIDDLQTYFEKIGLKNIVKQNVLEPLTQEGRQLANGDKHSLLSLFFVGFISEMDKLNTLTDKTMSPQHPMVQNIMDVASKYAYLQYTFYMVSQARGVEYKPTSFEETGLGQLPDGISFELEKIDKTEDSATIRITSLYDEALLSAIIKERPDMAQIVDENTILVTFPQ